MSEIVREIRATLATWSAARAQAEQAKTPQDLAYWQHERKKAWNAHLRTIKQHSIKRPRWE